MRLRGAGADAVLRKQAVLVFRGLALRSSSCCKYRRPRYLGIERHHAGMYLLVHTRGEKEADATSSNSRTRFLACVGVIVRDEKKCLGTRTQKFFDRCVTTLQQRKVSR